MAVNIESLIFKGLVHDDIYLRKVFPYLKDEYFTGVDKTLFTIIKSFIDKYNKAPSVDVLRLGIEHVSITEDQAKECRDIVTEISDYDNQLDYDWLKDATEEFCKNTALNNAIYEAYEISEGRVKGKKADVIPDLLKDALGVSFDTNIGHDYFNDAEARWDFYTAKEDKIPFKLKMLNRVTNGGLPKGTLSIIMAGTNVGKSLIMCDYASGWIADGYNVLYITLEMAEEFIAQRIDANLLDVDINKIEELGAEKFKTKFDKVRQKTQGKFVIKQYPTGSASVSNFRMLLSELKLKKGFSPDFICVDYLNICCSSRYSGSSGENSYSMMKHISEELRGLAVEYGVRLITGTQTNRQGMASTDIDLTNISESTGPTHTADLLFGVVYDEELNNYFYINLKNRFGNKNSLKRFPVGVDYTRMRQYDMDSSSNEPEPEYTTKPSFDKKSVDGSEWEM